MPRALYMDSQLKVRIDGGTTWPLASTEFFAEDDAQAEMSEAVTAVTAGTLTGSQAYWLLQYLLQNTTGDLVYEVVDVTSYVPLLNLPTDALQIIPWTGVTNGPTGTMPQDFWDWLGSLANTIVNGLLTAGQLIYGGLIAIGTFFVALGEAIVEWGMALVGTFQAALGQIQQAVERAADVFLELKLWVYDNVRARYSAIVEDASQYDIGFLLEHPDSRSFAASVGENSGALVTVEQVLWNGNLWLQVLTFVGPLIAKVPQLIALHIFALPFFIAGLLTHQELLSAAEQAGRENAGALGSLDDDQVMGLALLLVGVVLSEIGTHIIIAAVAAGAASLGFASFIAAPEVIAGLILDAMGIGLMLWGFLILTKALSPPGM